MTHSLTLGSLLLTDPLPDDDHGYVFSVLAEGAGFGVARGVREVVTSLLADGDLVRTTRFGNREVSFAVRIEGPTLSALAHGEAALRQEVGGGNTLTWQAPDVLSVPTVFDVVDSEMAQTFDDLDELRRRRTFVLTLTCAPFARSADLVTVAALAAPDAPVSALITAADDPATWVATASNSAGGSTGVTVTDEGAYVQATSDMPPPVGMGRWMLSLEHPLSVAVDMTTTPYVRLESSGSGGIEWFSVKMDGLWSDVKPTLSRASGSVVAHFLDVSGLGTSLSAVAVKRGAEGPATLTVAVHDVTRTNTLEQVSPRQTTRVIEVGGTERTPASIHVQSADGVAALGQCIVHTAPEDGSGYSPPLQRWRTVGQARTADATAFSGTYESINTTSWVAEVPTSALPEGGYVLLARLRAQTAGVVSITWSTSTIFPDATTQQGYTVGAFNHDFAVGNEWDLVPIEVLSLPSIRTKAGKVQIALQVAAASPVVTLDEAWLFRDDDDCALTIVETTRPHLWLDSPDLTSPVPRVWIGDGGTTRVHPGEGLNAMGAHVLSPEGTAVFTAALTDYPATDATFYRRWHSNAAS